MSSPSRAGLARAALPILAISVFAAAQIGVLASAGSTLGYDFLAYHAAARRVLEGAPLYEFDHERAGGFGLFLYPPTFLPLVLPFGLLDETVASWTWIGAMVAALLAGIRLLPVAPAIRWATLLLAGLSWPVAYTIKLGQITPILFLLAVLGWRAVASAGAGAAGGGAGAARGGAAHGGAILGATAAVGAAIKLQPGLLLAWAALSRRWTAVLWGVVVLAGLSAVSLVTTGPGSWFDYAALIRQITDPVTTDRNVTPGAIAHDLGMSVGAATALQVGVMVVALVAVVVTAWRALPVASYLVAVSASQLISPVLWDHYAMLLLLPVAWLLAERQRWAILIPLATSLPLIWLTPPIAYPLAFALTLAATLIVGVRRPDQGAVATRPLPAASAPTPP
jgi:hypothetical protein